MSVFPPPVVRPAAPPPDQRRRSPWLVGALVASIMLLPLVVAIYLVASLESVQEDAVRAMARAPAGCETRLELERAGTFYLYVETRGRIDSLEGDCTGRSRLFRSDVARPAVSMTLTRDGREIPLEARSGVDYDVGGFRGEVVQVFEAVQEGTVVLTVQSEHDVVVAVGRDVDQIVRSRLTGALLLATGSVLLAGGAGTAAGWLVHRRNRRDQRSQQPPDGGGPSAGQFVAPVGWPSRPVLAPPGGPAGTPPIAPPLTGPPITWDPPRPR
jgi:hypothetical protein